HRILRSIHGRYRVGGDRLKFAMPEVGIGFIPDVGGAYFLPRLPRRIGWWLATTGTPIGVGDAIFAHVVDYYVRSSDFDALIERIAAEDLGATSDEADEALCGILAEMAAAPPEAGLRTHALEIETACEAESLAQAIAALEAGSDWEQAQAALIAKKSPTALALTWEMLRRGAACATLEEALRIEYRLARDRVVSAEFREGVRAAVIDKDHAPNWSPATLAAVDPALVAAAFAPLGAEELSFAR
ncbi:MAG: enoyl-CoA hydratase/isomerase family protein, partial [Pseudomonadota bacterium]